MTAALAAGHVVAVFWVLLDRGRQPTATLAWMLAVVFLPYIGVFAYLVIRKTRARRRSRRLARVTQRIQSVLAGHLADGVVSVGDTISAAMVSEPGFRSLVKLGQRLATVEPTRNNAVHLLVDGDAAYRSMLDAIETASHHVHVEFYIIQPDRVGTQLRDHLARKASQGVEVRVLCDGFGSIDLPGDFWDPVRQAGGHAATYQPVWSMLRLFRGWHRVDFRNHRKIVVVDGRIGFTGGINVGKEYLGEDPELGSWRDSHVRIEGPAVLAMQKAFAEDWLNATEQVVEDPSYFPGFEAVPGTARVQIVDSGPDRTWSPIKHFICLAIGLARDRVWITTPYFIPAPSVEAALQSAALRGVDVRILLPGRSDNMLVRLASSTYYSALFDAGAKIWHYQTGFVHAKTMVVDGWLGSVGSANMDNRSLTLNFELDAFVYDRAFVEELASSFEADLTRSRPVCAADLRTPFYHRVASAVARLLSPLL